MDRNLFRLAWAEFLGTFVLMTFGLGSVAQAKLGGAAYGSFLTINFAWGVAVVMGICVSGAVSGAHLNPAVTLAFAWHRRLAWRKVPAYLAGQVLGAFVASIVTYLVYIEALNAFDGGVRQIEGPLGTAGIFVTGPSAHLSTFPGGFIDQFVATALLSMCLFGLSDARNEGWSKSIGPLVVGLLIVVIGMSFGLNAGYAVNPARDFGPRVFAACFGWGAGVFSVGNHWWWVPILAPCLGAITGATIYQATASVPATSKTRLEP